MKIAFLVLAHKNPSQLVHLFKMLSHENTGIFLHLDKRVNDSEFIVEFEKNNVIPNFICRDQRIIYSSIRYIYATLKILKEAFDRGYDYFVLISGQDLPVKPISHIVDFFTANKDKSFIQYETIPCSNLGYMGYTRTRFYNFKVFNKMETLFPWNKIKHKMSWKGEILNTILWVRNFFKSERQFPLNMQPYYSSQWWNISRESVAYILSFLNDNPKYMRYHKNALHPEEMFFQSILINSSELKEKIINDNLRYIKWEKGKKHPELLTEKDLAEAANTIAIFARKFNLNA